MLYAAGVPDEQSMQTKPHVGIASVFWEGQGPVIVTVIDFADRDR